VVQHASIYYNEITFEATRRIFWALNVSKMQTAYGALPQTPTGKLLVFPRLLSWLGWVCSPHPNNPFPGLGLKFWPFGISPDNSLLCRWITGWLCLLLLVITRCSSKKFLFQWTDRFLLDWRWFGLWFFTWGRFQLYRSFWFFRWVSSTCCCKA